MMKFVQTARVLLSWCLILLLFGSGDTSSPTFTKEPPSRVPGILHSNATFHWILAFGDSDLSEIIWGETDGGARFTMKYITVYPSGSHSINKVLDSSFKDRLFVTVNVSRNGCYLKFVLKNVTRSDEGKTYGCEAEFKNGDEVKSGPMELVVQVPPKITSRSNATLNVEEGEPVKLPCEANGKPTPSINWTKGDKALQISNTTTAYIIPNIELKDGGTYVCTASNPAGSAFYSVFVKVVRYRPYINKTASSNATVKSWLNHVTRLKCAVDANPAANFTWFKDGRPILNGVNSTHDISTLRLRPNTTGDFGRYFCKAENVKGTAWYNITVKQLFPPGPPLINKLVPDILSISATWNRSRDDGGSPILDYRITLFEANADKQQRQSVVTGNNYTFGSLNHNRTYKIVIRARNVVGYGKSANATIATLGADPPRVLSVTTVPSLMAVNVSWNSTNDNTGVMILDYRILLIDTITQQQQEITGINVLKLYIANLTHNRTYVIKVQARNEDGYGRFMSRNFTTLEAEPPGAPVIKVVPRFLALQLTWNSSAQDVNNIKILDYRVKVLDGTNIKKVYTGITTTSLLIENLARNRTYVIEIQARNEVGYGEIANISATTLSAGPPDAPLITNITVDGKRCSLQWTIPYNGESPIEIYTVTVWLYRASNGSDFKETPNSWNTTKATYSLVDLQWSQNYTTAVSAWNKYGQSFYGRERRFTTGKFQGLTSTIGTELLSTSPSITGDVTSPKETPTSFTEYTNENEDRTKESGAKKEGKPTKNTFVYLAPLWVVIMAFAIPAVAFMLWKGTQKFLLRCCCKGRPRPGRRRELHNRTSESSVDTMDDVKDKTLQGTDHYETITEILEMHYNHGYTVDADESSGNGQPKKPNSLPEIHVYNHLHETSLDSGLGLQQTPTKSKQVGQVKPIKQCHKELKSGLGLFPNHEYSHLIHSDSFSDRQPPVPNEYSTIPSRCQWEISRDRLKLHRTIGSGEFGVVKKGLALNVNQKGGWIPVAVKTLNDNEEANELCRKDLLSELKLMKGLSPHNHVVQLLACITESEPLCVITEFAPYGDLLGFLRKKRGLKDDYYNIEQLPRGSFTSQQLMQFAWEIADGMAYLSSEKIIHRDLAARNVLLGDNLTCKVTDFGMARDIRRQDMYQRNAGGRLPVKWTAIEALLHGLYTTKSDVWSFGVVLFEIVTIGGSPYPGMEVLELIDKLESGYRMEKPRHAADEVYALMLSCWNEDPGGRPTFRQLHSTLKQLADENEGCISLKTYDGRLYENVQTPSR